MTLHLQIFKIHTQQQQQQQQNIEILQLCALLQKHNYSKMTNFISAVSTVFP